MPSILVKSQQTYLAFSVWQSNVNTILTVDANGWEFGTVIDNIVPWYVEKSTHPTLKVTGSLFGILIFHFNIKRTYATLHRNSKKIGQHHTLSNNIILTVLELTFFYVKQISLLSIACHIRTRRKSSFADVYWRRVLSLLNVSLHNLMMKVTICILELIRKRIINIRIILWKIFPIPAPFVHLKFLLNSHDKEDWSNCLIGVTNSPISRKLADFQVSL